MAWTTGSDSFSAFYCEGGSLGGGQGGGVSGRRVYIEGWSRSGPGRFIDVPHRKQGGALF